MIDSVFTKLLSSLTDPAALVLLMFILYLIWEKKEYKKECSTIMSALLKAQDERGVTLAKISLMIDQILRSAGRSA